MYRSALVSSLLTAAVLLTACDGGGNSAGDRSSAAAGSTPTAGEAAGTPTPAADGGTSAGDTPGRGAGGEAPDAEGPDAGAPAPEEPVADAPGAPAPDAPAPEPAADLPPLGGGRPGAWPQEVPADQGARVWAVYLATGSPIVEWDGAELGETEAYLNGLGYAGSGIASVACDQGAAEALGFSPDDDRLAVYFATAADAQVFVGLYDRQDVGSAQVTLSCRG